ncbi:MAG TPA: ABC transporter permease [Cyclobacteriaceae bacterium]|nr:ABC transporter permease [Cyclobacteriaceae bacterium]
MFRNYLITAIRNLVRHKGFSIINLLGLTVGLSTSMLILIWIQDEVTYDRFNTDIDRLYEVFENQTYSADKIYTFAATPGPLANTIVSEYPEVETAFRCNWGGRDLFAYRENSFYGEGRYADSTLFKMLTFQWKEGDPSNPLPDVSSLVLSSSLAGKLFGSESALGKMVRFRNRNDLKVTAVFNDLPSNSSLQFEYVAPFTLYEKDNPWLEQWGNNGIMTFVKLKPGADYRQLNNKIADYIKTKNEGSVVTLFLHPYKDLRLYSSFIDGKLAGGRITVVIAFGFIALFILVIACINFMNLTTARSAVRTREVGVRKVIGASTSSLVKQFMGESFLITFLAMAISVLLIRLLLPLFNDLTFKKVSLDFSDFRYWLGLLAILIITAVLSGSYPALFLSSFKPASILKNQSRSGLRGTGLRRILVVIQFSLSIILIASALIIYKQIIYLQTKDLGYDKENIIYFWEHEGIRKNFDAYRNEILEQSYFAGIGKANNMPFQVGNSTSDPSWEGKSEDDNILFQIYQTDYDFIATLGFELKDGRFFSREFVSDSVNCIVNEEAARRMGMEDPVGQSLEMWGFKGQIIGLVKDFHSNSLYNPIEPLIFLLNPKNTWATFIKVEPGKTKEAIAYLETLNRKYDPEFPFEYHFLDKSYEELYNMEMTVARLADYFTGIAIFIACLGLFGLASFTVERRAREIGIRKVFGASVSRLVVMLCRDFAWLILIALVIGCPVAWFLMGKFLSMYKFHTTIGSNVFIVTAFGILVIALLTVGFQSLKASLANPVNSLRSE